MLRLRRGVSLTEPRWHPLVPGPRARAPGGKCGGIPRCSTAWIAATSPCPSTWCAAGAKGAPAPALGGAGTDWGPQHPGIWPPACPAPGPQPPGTPSAPGWKRPSRMPSRVLGLDQVALSCPARLNRLLLGPDAGAGLVGPAGLARDRRPCAGAPSPGRAGDAQVQAHGTVSLLTFALEFLARFQRFPAAALPRPG